MCFMLVLTHGVLFRPYCIEEIFVAATLKKPVLLVCETDEKYHPFVFKQWKEECKKAGGDHAWCLAELSKVEMSQFN